MKLTASREALLKPLQAVIGVVERRQTMPILANVLLVARDDSVSVTATDLEVELVADVEAHEVSKKRHKPVTKNLFIFSNSPKNLYTNI